MKVRNIRIQNFLSIKDLTYNFEEGLHLFKGNNGHGKSSILQALQVGLFNKCDRPMPWGRIGGPGGFIITTEFKNIEGKEVKVINDRTRNRFEVYENDILLTHQISKGLPLVTKMLNLTYSEFSMLSYLTPSTVSSILTGTDNSLISKFFSLHVLQDYDKALREERKLLSRDKKNIEIQLADAIVNTQTYNLVELNDRLTLLLKTQEAFRGSPLAKKVAGWEEETNEKTNNLTLATFSLQEKTQRLSSLEDTTSSCPTCGQSLKIDTTAILASTIKLKQEIVELTTKITVDSKSLEELSGYLNKSKGLLTRELTGVADKLREQEAKVLAASIVEERDTIDTDKLNKELASIERKINSLNITISAIKSGEVHKSYLETFTSVLNGNLGNIKQTLGIKFRVVAKIDTNGLSFSILDDGIYKFSAVLSSGEKVIVGLMVLLAMFETLGDTLDITISTIMLDEAISAVSPKNMEAVESLLKELAKERCVIITQHHGELPEELFDTINIVQKVDGLTEIN